MTDIELLPLHYDELPEIPEDIVVRMQAYARANMEPLLAENERLRAEVERLRRLVQERDTMLGKRLCSGTNADGKPRCIVLAEERARAERLAEALRDARRALAFAAQHLPECNEPYERANRALAQEDRND